jgi:predicted AAA+ superfamily ATPase
MPVSRLLLPLLRRLLEDYPAASLLGPRQSGKTTLGRSLGGTYFDLERDADRARLDLTWNSLAAAPGLLILDEAQAHPPLFNRLRGEIDADRKRNGRFLLLGSVSPALLRQVSQSLAGRLGLCELSAFLLSEVDPALLDRLWLMGGFPDGGILSPKAFPEWQSGYLALLAQRDLPEWGFPAKPSLTLRMLRMLAASHGTAWSASDMGRSLGLSYHTAEGYLDFLEGTFLIRRLYPLHASIRKRLAKRPRIYWRDSGLLHALLKAGTTDELLDSPWVGASWEGFVIEQALGLLAARGRPHDASFFRTHEGHEIDLVLDFGKMRWAVEVKLSASPGPGDLSRLVAAADLIQAERRVLVSRTKEPMASGNLISTDLPGFLRLLKGV